MKYVLKILYVIIALITLLSTCTISAVFWFSSAHGNIFIKDLITKELSNTLDYKVEIEDISFNLPLRINISNISISDHNIKWLEAKNTYINILPIALLSRNYSINTLNVEKVSFFKLPENTSNTSKVSIYDLSVTFPNINIKEIFIEKSILGSTNNLIASLNGKLKWLGLGNQLLFTNRISIKPLDISISGMINLNSNDIDLDLQVSDIKLEDWIEDFSGNYNLVAKINGSIEKPIIASIIKSNNLLYKHNKLPNLVTSIKGSLIGEKLSGNIETNINDSGQLKLNYLLSKDILELNSITGNYLSTSILGNISLNLNNMLMDGKLDINSPFIENFSEYLPVKIAGQINSYSVLDSKSGKQKLTNIIKLNKILIDKTSIDKAIIEINIANQITSHPELIQIKAEKVKHNNLIVDNFSFLSSYKDNRWQIESEAKGGNVLHPFHIITHGIYLLENNNKEIQVTLNNFKGEYNLDKFFISKNIIMNLNSLNKSISIPKLNIAGGYVSLKASLKQEEIDLVSKGNNFSLKSFRENLPNELKDKEISFNFSMLGNISSPKVEATLITSNINANISIKDNNLILIAKSKNDPKSNYKLEANIPIDFSLSPFRSLIKQSDPIKGKIDGLLDISSLPNGLIPNDHNLKGKFIANLLISGSYSSPLINGKIKYTNGYYHNYSIGIKLYNINSIITSQNNKLIIDNFTTEDEQKNILNLNGTIYNNSNNYSYQFALNTNKFSPVNRPNSYNVISGKLSIKGDNKSGNVDGSLNIEKLDIYLPDELNNDISTINIVEVINKQDQVNKINSKEFLYPIFLDIKLQAKNKVFIRGWGVDAELGGNLSINGEIKSPQIRGKLSVLNGKYEEFGKKFKIKLGELLFEGDIPPSPYLNIIGSITQDGVEINPTLTGSIISPSLKIDSSPSTSQEDALSLLLFGKDSSKINTFQAIQLANSLKKLSTNSSSNFDPLKKIRDTFGLDDISINESQDSSKSLSVGVSKYITSDVRITVDQGEKAEDNKAGIEIDITPHISIESKTSVTGSNDLGINYKYNY